MTLNSRDEFWIELRIPLLVEGVGNIEPLPVEAQLQERWTTAKDRPLNCCRRRLRLPRSVDEGELVRLALTTEDALDLLVTCVVKRKR